MKLSEQGLALIKECEGFASQPYICPAGKVTIGYGHVVKTGESYPPQGLNRETADALLANDVEWAERAVLRLIAVPLRQGQFDALVSLVYNIGEKAFEISSLRRILNAGDQSGAQAQFGRWVHAGGKKLEGLVRRRAKEAALFAL